MKIPMNYSWQQHFPSTKSMKSVSINYQYIEDVNQPVIWWLDNVGHFPAEFSTSLEYHGWNTLNEIHGDLSSKYDYVWWSNIMIKYDYYEEHIKQIWWSNNGIFIRQNWRSELSDDGQIAMGPSEWERLPHTRVVGNVWNISYVLVNQIIHYILSMLVLTDIPQHIPSGWWFGTCFFSIYWELHHPNWLSLHHFSEG